MKKKLFVTILLAGGSMFAQTRFSNAASYYPSTPVCTENAPAFEHRAIQSRDTDDYARQNFNRGFDRDQERGLRQELGQGRGRAHEENIASSYSNGRVR